MNRYSVTILDRPDYPLDVETYSCPACEAARHTDMAAGDVIFFVIDGLISRVEQLDDDGQVFFCEQSSDKKARAEIAANGATSAFHKKKP